MKPWARRYADIENSCGLGRRDNRAWWDLSGKNVHYQISIDDALIQIPKAESYCFVAILRNVWQMSPWPEVVIGILKKD